MGTNFYLNTDESRPSLENYTGMSTLQEWHIGKRSAAGWYCWDCRRTLCRGGEQSVHQGKSAWHEACPVCGGQPRKEGLADGAAGRELGFNKKSPGAKTGVASCSSFTWAMKPEEVLMRLNHDPEQAVLDEYGRVFSREEFLQVLEECPIRKFSIGQCFG